MAEQTMDKAIKVCNLQPASGCRTKGLLIDGAHDIDLINKFVFSGGKWTTYRSMAEQTMDKAIEVCNLQPASGCRTKGLLMDGAHGWSN